MLFVVFPSSPCLVFTIQNVRFKKRVTQFTSSKSLFWFKVPDYAESWMLQDLMGLTLWQESDQPSDASLPENVQKVDQVLHQSLPPVGFLINLLVFMHI